MRHATFGAGLLALSYELLPEIETSRAARGMQDAIEALKQDEYPARRN